MSTAAPTTLRTLAEAKTEGVTKLTTFRVDPNLIKFQAGFNLRDEGPDLDEHIERLYLAYKAGDMVPAIDVSVVEVKGKNTILARDGHCRTQAAKKWRKEMPEFQIECRQFRGNDADAVMHMLNSGTGGLRLTPLQEGRGYLRLLKMGLTAVQIAEKRHVSRVTVDNGITLAEAPAEVQQWIIEGKVSSTTARDAIKGGELGIAALRKAVAAQDEQPAAPSKPGKGAKPKKKKVTAKKLKGTAAEKKVKKIKIINSETTPDQLLLTIQKRDVDALVKLIRTHAAEDEGLQAFATTLETALL